MTSKGGLLAFIREYMEQLDELDTAIKSKINSLSMLAAEEAAVTPAAAAAVAAAIEKRIQSANPSAKLPALFLLDSIVKNAKEPFIQIFTRNLPQSFSAVWNASPRDRRTLERVLGTWGSVFPPEPLLKLRHQCGLASPAVLPAPSKPEPSGAEFDTDRRVGYSATSPIMNVKSSLGQLQTVPSTSSQSSAVASSGLRPMVRVPELQRQQQQPQCHQQNDNARQQQQQQQFQLQLRPQQQQHQLHQQQVLMGVHQPQPQPQHLQMPAQLLHRLHQQLVPVTFQQQQQVRLQIQQQHEGGRHQLMPPPPLPHAVGMRAPLQWQGQQQQQSHQPCSLQPASDQGPRPTGRVSREYRPEGAGLSQQFSELQRLLQSLPGNPTTPFAIGRPVSPTVDDLWTSARLQVRRYVIQLQPDLRELLKKPLACSLVSLQFGCQLPGCILMSISHACLVREAPFEVRQAHITGSYISHIVSWFTKTLSTQPRASRV